VYYRDLDAAARLSGEPPPIDNGRGHAFFRELESVMEEIINSVKEES
jgi:hypothetical protein